MIKVGSTTFRDTVCDGNVLFRVISKTGDAYKCVVEPNEPDYGGTVRYYDAQQINARTNQAKFFDQMSARRDDFWAWRTPGEVLHYHDGFGKFVRGVVIELDGMYKLRPTALVGKWQGFHDLPRRQPNGDIYYPYHAKKVVFGGDDACWQPSDTCVFEAPAYSSSYTRNGDPRKLEAIDLTVPEPDAEAAAIAVLERKIDRVRAILEERYQTSAPAEKVLEDIIKAAQGHIR